MESFIFTVRQEDVESLNKSMSACGLTPKPHVTLAFDSATPPEWVQVIINGVTSPAAMSCLSAAVGYFFARNKGKKLEVHTKGGTKIIIEGFSQAETTAILKDSIGQIMVKEDKPT